MKKLMVTIGMMLIFSIINSASKVPHTKEKEVLMKLHEIDRSIDSLETILGYAK